MMDHPERKAYLDFLARCCEERTFDEGLAMACVWECDRAVRQALKNERDADGKLYDTVFIWVIRSFRAAWKVTHEKQ